MSNRRKSSNSVRQASLPLMAFDRSLRTIDADGHMRVEESRISKANVCPYKGYEIPNCEALGLDPERTYKLFRDPSELAKGASTFDGKPLLIRHVPVSGDLPQKDLWVGTLGKCTFESPYLVTRPLMVLTTEAIDLIGNEEQRELSAAYRYDAVMEPGMYDGVAYDGRMVNIRGNHVALVAEGRAGPDVHVADEFPTELKPMKHSALFNALKPFLKAGISPLAFDAALGETPAESIIGDAELDEKEKKEAEDCALDAKRRKHGRDAQLDDEEREEAYERARDAKRRRANDEREEAMDAREEAMDSAEEMSDKDKDDEGAKDRKRARDSRRKARDSRKHSRDSRRAHDAMRAKDAMVDHRKDFEPAKGDSVTKDEMNAAIRVASDSARESMRKQMTELAIAREAVLPIVGKVSIAMDSAESVYKFALEHAGVKVEGVHPSAFPALIDMVKSTRAAPRAPSHAMDAGAGSVNIDEIFGRRTAA